MPRGKKSCQKSAWLARRASLSPGAWALPQGLQDLQDPTMRTSFEYAGLTGFLLSLATLPPRIYGRPLNLITRQNSAVKRPSICLFFFLPYRSQSVNIQLLRKHAPLRVPVVAAVYGSYHFSGGDPQFD